MLTCLVSRQLMQSGHMPMGHPPPMTDPAWSFSLSRCPQVCRGGAITHEKWRTVQGHSDMGLGTRDRVAPWVQGPFSAAGNGVSCLLEGGHHQPCPPSPATAATGEGSSCQCLSAVSDKSARLKPHDLYSLIQRWAGSTRSQPGRGAGLSPGGRGAQGDGPTPQGGD